LVVARLADDDPWRQRLREALVRADRAALVELAEREDTMSKSPQSLVSLSRGLRYAGSLSVAERLLRRAQAAHPADFWLNFELGFNLAVKEKNSPEKSEAIRFYQAALALRPQSAVVYLNLGSALLDKGRLDEAVAEYREAIRIDKDYALSHSNLGAGLSDKGRLDEAIAEYREAILLDKDNAVAHYNLGYALRKKGRLDEAIAEYREAIRIKKDFPEAHNNLGIALRVKGALDKLPGILKGEARPADAAECLALAELCQQPYQSRYAASARFFGDAFAAEPKLADDLDALHRYNAACAAALAGCGQGNDAAKLDDKERARLRRQSLDWLRADLKAYRQLMEKSAGKAGPAIAQRMQHWLQDADFAGVRGAEALAKLPEGERQSWQQLWADVADMLARGRGDAAPKPKPDTK
jgi:Tfp pilus assembly protein PilF